MATRKRVGEISGFDIGRTVTVIPGAGLTFTDELRSVVHGDAVNGFEDAGWVLLVFRNIAPRNGVELRTEGFKFMKEDKVEVHD